MIGLHELKIRYDALTPEQQEIFDCVGADAYTNLVEQFGGMSIYIAKPETVYRTSIFESIRNDFNGHNTRYLARKYGLSERKVRKITADIRLERLNEAYKNQISFLDDE